LGNLPTNNPAIAILIEGRLITINTTAGWLNMPCRNLVNNEPVARPRDILVNKKACPTGISRMRMSGRWKVTVNNIGKNTHDRPFTTAETPMVPTLQTYPILTLLELYIAL